MRRLLAFAAFLATAQGCRCNSVDEKQLPAAAPETTPAAAPAPAPAPAGSATPLDCGPDIGGIDTIATAPVVLLGELHGLRAAPIFAIDLVCRLTQTSSGGVTLALEIPTDEQPRIDAYLASQGRAADRAALLAGGFWTGSRDGRSSGARVDMLEQARGLRRRGLDIRVITIDGAMNVGRDEAMAKRVVAAVETQRGPVVVLVGNLHARTQPGGGQKWMGEFVRARIPNVVSLDNRYASGEAWVCIPECGTKKMTGQDPDTDTKWRIERLQAPDEKGFAGTWHIGPAKASPPAVTPPDGG